MGHYFAEGICLNGTCGMQNVVWTMKKATHLSGLLTDYEK